MIENIQKYTQGRINTWYQNAKIDYGVDGWGKVKIDNEVAQIKFTEDGVTKVFEEPTMFLKDERIDYLFNIWSESY